MLNNKYSNKLTICNEGFTLIELSIVMVIVALLIGGILAGQSLIEGANTRSLINQISSYRSALNIFQTKFGYNAIPGDFNMASQFIAEATNGDGNGLIGSLSGNSGCNANSAIACGGHGQGNPNNNIENTNFWYQLSALGLISGSFTNASTSQLLQIDKNIPSIKMNQSFGIISYSINTYNKNYFCIGYSTTLGYGNAQTFLSPNTAFDFDRKIDDGNPIDGKVAARGNHTSGVLEYYPSITGFSTPTSGSSASCLIGTSYGVAPNSYNTSASYSSTACALRVDLY